MKYKEEEKEELSKDIDSKEKLPPVCWGEQGEERRRGGGEEASDKPRDAGRLRLCLWLVQLSLRLLVRIRALNVRTAGVLTQAQIQVYNPDHLHSDFISVYLCLSCTAFALYYFFASPCICFSSCSCFACFSLVR
jgi:hypothetical protein